MSSLPLILPGQRVRELRDSSRSVGLVLEVTSTDALVQFEEHAGGREAHRLPFDELARLAPPAEFDLLLRTYGVGVGEMCVAWARVLNLGQRGLDPHRVKLRLPKVQVLRHEGRCCVAGPIDPQPVLRRIKRAAYHLSAQVLEFEDAVPDREYHGWRAWIVSVRDASPGGPIEEGCHYHIDWMNYTSVSENERRRID